MSRKALWAHLLGYNLHGLRIKSYVNCSLGA
jgi:hypothetical protein